jgi:hypothetical protein
MRLHHEPGAVSMDKSKSSNLGSTGGPVEMKHYDKIPRTPIDPALLEQIKRDNVRLRLLQNLGYTCEKL